MPSDFVEKRKFASAVVNGESAGFQGNPKVAAFSDGRYVVVWNDESGLGGDADGSGVKGRIFSSAGSPLTSEFLVNKTTADAQYVSSVAVVDGDKFVVSWTTLDPDAPDNANAQARIFTSAGVAAGDEFAISDAAGYQEGAIVTNLGNGGFLATWTDYGPSGTTMDGDVRGQRYDANGAKLGAEFTVNSVTIGNQALPDAALLTDGRFVVTWSDAGAVADGPGGLFDTSFGGIKGQIFAADGSKVGNEIAINGRQSGLQSNSTVAALSAGGFVVGWTDFSTNSKALARTFDGTGVAQTGPFFLGLSTYDQQSSPDLVAWKDGGFLALYSTGSSSNYSTQDVVARGFSDTGVGRPYEAIVNAGRFGLQLEPTAAILADGSVAIAWRHVRDNAESRGDGSGPGVLHTGFTMRADIAGNGTMIGTYSSDRLMGDQGSDNLLGYGGDDLLDGGAGSDRIDGGAGTDELQGGTGDDSLVGGAGADRMFGGGGNDSYIVDDAGDRAIELSGEGRDTVYATVSFSLERGSDVEVLTVYERESGDALRLTGNGLAQAIYGNAGVNLLDSGGGADLLYGLTGDDSYFVRGGGEQVIEFADGGNDTVYAFGNFTLGGGSSVETITAYERSGTAALSLAGNELANRIIGNNGINSLRGGGGADVLYGLRGDDSYVVDSSAAQIIEIAGDGRDTVYTTTNFNLGSDAEVEVLLAYDRAGTARLDLGGNGFGQTIYGNDGVNSINSGGGADILYGLGGDDSFLIDGLNDLIYEFAGGGNDTVYTIGSFALLSDAEIETLTVYERGTANALNLSGSNTANRIIGNNGANVLDGKGGIDTLYGLGSEDTFAFSTALGLNNVDTVVGFVSGSDRIQLSSGIFGSITAGTLSTSAFVRGTRANDADDRIIYDQTSGRLFYDADGSGSDAAVLFASLGAGTVLAASDFFLM